MKTPSLLIRLPNWVGDVIMSLPTLAVLEQLGLEITCLGKPWIKDLLAAYNYRCVILSADKDDTIEQVRATGIEYALCLPNSFSSALLFKRAGIKAFGYKADWRSWFLYKGFKLEKNQHQVDLYLNLAKQMVAALGLSWPEQVGNTPALQLTPDALAKAGKMLESINKPFNVFCPLAIGTYNSQPKVWPGWQHLDREFFSEQKTVISCPGPGELAETQKVLPHATIVDQLSLSEMAAVMSQAEHVYSNDSGPMHIAAAVGAKVTAYFGPSDPTNFAPRDRGVEVVRW